MREYEKDEIGSLIKSSAVGVLQVLDSEALIGCIKRNHYIPGIRGVVVV